MISQLFSLPLRALAVAAVLPPPSALGAPLAGQSILLGTATVAQFADHNDFGPPRIRTHSVPGTATDLAGR